jgi:lipopolysaccharide transport system ATP-binding protein
MSGITINVEGLGKRYRVAGGDLRQTLTTAAGRWMGRVDRAEPSRDLWALRDIEFGAREGDIIGILGGNGDGKTTLLQLLARITNPTEGRIRMMGKVGTLLDVGAGFRGELTGRENIYLKGAIHGMSARDIRQRFEEIVSFAELEEFVDVELKRYSTGMCVRLAFALAVHVAPEIFLVDEVLAVADVVFQRKCIEQMMEGSRHGQTILFVSHDLNLLRRVCNRAIVLQRGRLVFQGSGGEAADYYQNSARNIVNEVVGSA